MTPSLLTTDHLNKLANAGDISNSPDPNDRGLDDTKLDYAWLDRAQQFFEQVGVEILTVLFLAALPEAYLGVRGVQVLDMTGALENDWTNRIRRTGQYLLNVLTPIHPFGFEQTKTVHHDLVASATVHIRETHRRTRAGLLTPAPADDPSADFQGLFR